MPTFDTIEEQKRSSDSSMDLIHGLQTLTAMGFDEHTALLVMNRYNNDINAAVQYFLLIQSTSTTTTTSSTNINQPHTHQPSNLHKKKRPNDRDIIDKLKYPLSHTVSKHDLSPGDHIYCWRKYYMYQHHGIYVGHNKVIHYSGEITNASTSTIVKTTVDGFAKGDTLKRVQYGVSKRYFVLSRAGSCNTRPRDKVELIVERAEAALGSGKGSYDVIQYNCETFCLWCSLGIRYTDSVQSSSTSATVKGAIIGGMFLGGVGGAVIGGAVGNMLGNGIVADADEKQQIEVKEYTNYKGEKQSDSQIYSNMESRLISMGFNETMVAIAMGKCDNDINAAIQYILSSIKVLNKFG